MLKSFGVYEEDDSPADQLEAGAVDMEAAITPLMNTLSKYRNEVNLVAGDKDAVIACSDKLRDNHLPPLGIKVEDKGKT